ncbi:MAG: DUF2834 domain-containing protein [Snowella sp.]|nr:DUF2834 domain-containing protein [Snowella sp.]
MTQKITLTILWLGFVVYAFFLSPPNQPDTFELIKDLSTGQWDGINTLVISLFNLMGVWPLAYACVLLADGRGQKIRAYPFVLGSMFVGAFAVLPYLIFRNANPNFTGPKDWIIKLFDSRITAIFLLITALALLWFGFSQGNWTDFVNQWRSDRFIHTMSLDFCFLAFLFPVLIDDDLARRGMEEASIFRLLVWFPLLGPLVYLCLRSHLPNEVAMMEKPET